MKRTISAMVGKGSITHNNRDFIAENVDGERTKNNITYCNEKFKTYIMNCLMKLFKSTTKNKPEATE